MAAVPTIGRADRLSPQPGADETSVLYERYGRKIHAYCLHQLNSREEAEDATQTTFMNAFRGLSRGIAPESEQAWLFKIAENVCLSRRRTSWRRGKVESPSDFELLQDLAPAPARDRADELIGLEDALAAMPENQRRAILLREWQGLSYREIAEELELSQAAVETLIFRARRTLATGLQEPKKSKKRLLSLGQGLNLGTLLAGLKGILTGGAAVKAVAVTVAASTATVGAVNVERAVERRQAAAKPVVVVTKDAPDAHAAAPLTVVTAGVAQPAEQKAQPQKRGKAQPGAKRPKGAAPVVTEEHPGAAPQAPVDETPEAVPPAVDPPKHGPTPEPPRNESPNPGKDKDTDKVRGKDKDTDTGKERTPSQTDSSGPGSEENESAPAESEPVEPAESRGSGNGKGRDKDNETEEPAPVEASVLPAPLTEDTQSSPGRGNGDSADHGNSGKSENGNGKGKGKGKGKDK